MKASIYTHSQYRIWARLVHSGLYQNTSVVPPIQALQSTPQPPKRIQNEPLSNVIAGAAVSFVNAVHSPKSTARNSVVINAYQSPPQSPSRVDALSACRATDVRMKKLR